MGVFIDELYYWNYQNNPKNSHFFCWCGHFGHFIKFYEFTLQCTIEWGYLRVFWSFYFMILNLNCEIYDSGCNFWE
jgi:hypothetical protein